LNVWSVGPCDVNISFEKFGLIRPCIKTGFLAHGCTRPCIMDVGHPSLHGTCVEHLHNFTTSYWNVSITLHPPIAAEEEEGSCDACMEHGDMHFGHG
jgi:hypothetical protein